MATIRLRRGSMLFLCGLLASSLAVAFAADRSAEKILEEINATQVPSADPKGPAEVAKRQRLVDQKAKLILELYKSSPTNPELVKLMPERWLNRKPSSASLLTTKGEIDEILAKNKNPKLVAEAAYYKAVLAIKKPGKSAKLDDTLAAIDDFAKRSPKDDRAGQLLFQLASALTDKSKQAELYQRIQKEFPESEAAKRVDYRSKQVAVAATAEEMVGKPFVLAFTDAIKGTDVSIEKLRGKVVVIDFWATWCGPCVAEMPNMKKLYAEYKNKGVEFIGVSLDQSRDQGGLDSLLSYVEKNGIEWPQFYQGNYWQSEFSSAWHVNSIPCVFLVDAEGNLATVKARGQLEKLLPEYLNKAKSGSNKTASLP